MLKPRTAPADLPCSIDEAQRRILRLAPPAAGEIVSLLEAMGRYVARDVHAVRAQPPFESSAMDGWAVAGTDAGLYRLVGESRAGKSFTRALSPGEAVAISTGAPMPAGALRVVRREHATDRGRLVEVGDGARGADVRAAASDFAAGTLIASQGDAIDHLTIARLAAAGLGIVEVARQPTLAVLATGDEIVAPGARPRVDQIFDALSLPLALRARSAGAVTGNMTMIGDDPASYDPALDRLLPSDILVIIGGASGGRHDHARAALARRGMDLIVPSVLMKPGKPFWCAHMDEGSVVIGLPGNPVAALASVELFLIPLIRAWQGSRDPTPCLPVESPPGAAAARLETLLFGRRVHGRVIPLGGYDSAALAPLAGADVLLRPTRGMMIPLS